MQDVGILSFVIILLLVPKQNDTRFSDIRITSKSIEVAQYLKQKYTN